MDRNFIVQPQEALEKRFNLETNDDIVFEHSYNIALGQYAPVITNEEPKQHGLHHPKVIVK